MITPNVKITEVAADPNKCKVTLTDLKLLVAQLEGIASRSVKNEIELSISDGQLFVDYYVQPVVPAQMIQLDFKVTKEGAFLEEFGGGVQDIIEVDDNSDMIVAVEPLIDVSMVTDPEPACVMGKIEDIPEWALEKRKRASSAFRELTELLTNKGA